MIRHQVYRKKSLPKFQHATENVRAELEYRNIIQIDLAADNPDPLSVKGVIYAIIHIPSTKSMLDKPFKSAIPDSKDIGTTVTSVTDAA